MTTTPPGRAMGVATRLAARLRAHALAVVALVLGLGVFFSVVAVVPVYTAVASQGVLDDIAADDPEAPRPQFAYFFAADRADQPARWSELVPIDEELRTDRIDRLGVEVTRTDVRLRTRRFEAVGASGEQLGPLAVSAIAELGDLIRVRGEVPSTVEGIGVLVAEPLAETLDVDVGDPLTLVDPVVAIDDGRRAVEIVVSGVWSPIDADDRRWIVDPSNLVDELLTDLPTVIDELDAGRPPVIAGAQWYVVGSGEGITPDRVDDLRSGQRAVVRRLDAIDPEVSLLLAPDDLLGEFQRRSDELRDALAASAVPGAMIVGLFVVLAVAYHARQRQTELAIGRSRGISITHSLGSIAAELVVVLVVAAALGSVLSFALAQLMVRTRAFLDVDPGATGAGFWQFPHVPMSLLVVCGLGVLALQLALLVGPARRTIVGRRARRSRFGQAVRGTAGSWDLAVVAVVAAVALQRSRSDALPVTGLDDPWLIGLPAAAGLAVGLLVVRALPAVVRAAAAGLGRLPGTAWFLAAQRLRHSPELHRGPLLLVIMSTALAAFLASLSLTLEQQLIDETYLSTGADHTVVEVLLPGAASTPLDTFADADGVDDVSRGLDLAGRFGDRIAGAPELQVQAVDPESFAAVAHWRSDFDDRTLNELMASLRAAPDRALISRSAATRFDLGVGDPFRYAIPAGTDSVGATNWLVTNGTVAAVVDRFPRWTGDEKPPLVVPRVDFVLTQLPEENDSTTLIRLDDPTSAVSFDVGTVETSARDRIDREQLRPGRQGVFGILTATFLATTTVALLALVLQSLFSYRERAIETGVLRALGLGRRGVGIFVAFDFVVIGLLGIVVGAATGVGIARWLLPDLAVALTTGGELPGTARIAWSVTLGVAAVFVAAIAALVAVVVPLLRRLRPFQALKLGESV
ncbi:MAG: ABC transporter permease [Actinomycetota bacterium]